MSLIVKRMVWKRYCRHDGTHGFDMRVHELRNLWSESAARWSRISSMISCGILGVVTVSVSTGVGVEQVCNIFYILHWILYFLP